MTKTTMKALTCFHILAYNHVKDYYHDWKRITLQVKTNQRILQQVSQGNSWNESNMFQYSRKWHVSDIQEMALKHK